MHRLSKILNWREKLLYWVHKRLNWTWRTAACAVCVQARSFWPMLAPSLEPTIPRALWRQGVFSQSGGYIQEVFSALELQIPAKRSAWRLCQPALCYPWEKQMTSWEWRLRTVQGQLNPSFSSDSWCSLGPKGTQRLHSDLWSQSRIWPVGELLASTLFFIACFIRLSSKT